MSRRLVGIMQVFIRGNYTFVNGSQKPLQIGIRKVTNTREERRSSLNLLCMCMYERKQIFPLLPLSMSFHRMCAIPNIKRCNVFFAL